MEYFERLETDDNFVAGDFLRRHEYIQVDNLFKGILFGGIAAMIAGDPPPNRCLCKSSKCAKIVTV
jgi:hypothetical protein